MLSPVRFSVSFQGENAAEARKPPKIVAFDTLGPLSKIIRHCYPTIKDGQHLKVTKINGIGKKREIEFAPLHPLKGQKAGKAPASYFNVIA